MAFGVLAQLKPAITTLTALYTCADGARDQVLLVVTNLSTAASFRVAVSPDGATITDAHYIAYNEPIEANTSLITAVLAINSKDVVRVYSSNGEISFVLMAVQS